MPTRVTAAVCGLAGFAIALVAGLAAENPADTVLWRALVALVVCNVAGWVVGTLWERTIAEAMNQYKRSMAEAEGKGGTPTAQGGAQGATGVRS